MKLAFGLQRVMVVGLGLGVLAACSSSAGDDDSSSEGGSAGVTSGTGGSSASAGMSALGGAGGAPAGAGGSSGSAGQGGPFFCPDYPTGAEIEVGWVNIAASVPFVGSGPMDSPIVSCETTGDHWLVSASGFESDEIDQTTMRFELTGGYHGPGVYTGRLADGVSAAFSHSDVSSFASASATDCTFCINEGGLSGTVSCIGLEGPEGAGLKVAHIPSGTFTCPGALPKPTELPVTEPAQLDDVVCHYVEKLGCEGAMPQDECREHIQGIGLHAELCYVEYERWLSCIIGERPSEFACGTSDTLSVTSGGCATELATLETCRANGPGGGGPDDLTRTPECDTFCARQMEICGTECDRLFDCMVPMGSCREAQLAFLTCGANPSAWMCFGTGYSLVCSGDINTCP